MGSSWGAVPPPLPAQLAVGFEGDPRSWKPGGEVMVRAEGVDPELRLQGLCCCS